MTGLRTTSQELIDQHVGARIRHGRMLLGWSQSELAAALGVTFQQIQKYESGANRISAARLWQIAQRFGLPPDWFFEELPGDLAPVPDPNADQRPDMICKRETLEFVRALQEVRDPRVCRMLYNLVLAIAREADELPDVAAAAE